MIGLARDVKITEAKVKEEINRSNVHILHGDLDSYESLKAGLKRSSKDMLLIHPCRVPLKPLRKSRAEASTILSPTQLDFPKILILLDFLSCK